MDLVPMAKSCRCFLDRFVLSPSLTFGISSYDKKTGKSSGPRSVTVSASATLYKMIVIFIAIMLILRAMSVFLNMKNRLFYMKKMRKKRKHYRKS